MELLELLRGTNSLIETVENSVNTLKDQRIKEY